MKTFTKVLAATALVSVSAVAIATAKVDEAGMTDWALADWMIAPTPVAKMDLVVFGGMDDIELDARGALDLALIDPSGSVVYEGTVRPNETILFKDEGLPAISLRFQQAFGPAYAER